MVKIFLGKTAVIGAGLMGSQIGFILAMGSKETVLMDVKQNSIDLALQRIKRYAETLHKHNLLEDSPTNILSRIWTTTSIEKAASNAEYIVEAVNEDLELKQSIFSKLDSITPPNTILASNTSSLQITKIAQSTENPHRVLGNHFVQPAHIMPTVEIIKGQFTSDLILNRSMEVWKRLGKIPLVVRVDVPGSLVNRLQHALIREANALLAKGVASIEDIDVAVSVGLAPRFMTAGPLEQRDINGIAIHYKVAGYLWKNLSGWKKALKYVKEKVDRGELGLTVGKGYYDWTGKDEMKIRQKKDEELIHFTKEALQLRQNG